jgi:hypothetical protein
MSSRTMARNHLATRTTPQSALAEGLSIHPASTVILNEVKDYSKVRANVMGKIRHFVQDDTQ